VEIRKKSFLALVNKEQNVTFDSAATTGGQEKLRNLIYFPWPPVKATLSFFNMSLFC
jgi:hypothetical protein